MENYDRYSKVSSRQYDRRGAMYYLCRIPSNRVLLPLADGLSGLKILDVGLGTGSYTRGLVQRNEVVGVDRNPHLCLLDIPVLQGDAADVASLVGERRFDVVWSTWMTEYLDPDKLSQFLAGAYEVLSPGGRLMTTFISRRGVGWLYVTLARRLKGIHKYNYSSEQAEDAMTAAGFEDVEFRNLRARLGIPWAYFATARRPA